MKLSHRLAVSIGVLFLFFIFTKTDRLQIHTAKIDKDSVVLAFGDSLTYGKGAPNKKSYPSQLERLIKRKVVNAGQSGELSKEGLKRLPSLLSKYKPSLVILCHGGNDLIQQKSKLKLKENLSKMIGLIKQSGAQVLLVGIANFKFIRFTPERLYQELAEQEHVLYEGEVLSQIENNKNLKSDRIHPNEKGYALMAEVFASLLKEKGLL